MPQSYYTAPTLCVGEIPRSLPNHTPTDLHSTRNVLVPCPFLFRSTPTDILPPLTTATCEAKRTILTPPTLKYSSYKDLQKYCLSASE